MSVTWKNSHRHQSVSTVNRQNHCERYYEWKIQHKVVITIVQDDQQFECLLIQNRMYLSRIWNIYFSYFLQLLLKAKGRLGLRFHCHI